MTLRGAKDFWEAFIAGDKLHVLYPNDRLDVTLQRSRAAFRQLLACYSEVNGGGNGGKINPFGATEVSDKVNPFGN